MSRYSVIDLAVDVDGTCFKHRYPGLGDDLGAAPWLIKASKLGCRIFLFTMRCGSEIDEAAAALEKAGVKITGKNYNPRQNSWTTSPKLYAQIYIDDASLGAPVVPDPEVPGRVMYDWAKAGPMLIKRIKELQK